MDFKNVQRRVYDVFNVLAAANIISKDDKIITFNGFGDLIQNIHRDFQPKNSESRQETTHHSNFAAV